MIFHNQNFEILYYMEHNYGYHFSNPCAYCLDKLQIYHIIYIKYFSDSVSMVSGFNKGNQMFVQTLDVTCSELVLKDGIFSNKLSKLIHTLDKLMNFI